MRTALLAQFGEVVRYEPGDPRFGSPFDVTGVYNPRHSLSSGSAAAGVETFGPAVFLAISSLPCDPELDDPTVVVRGKRHRVTERMPDGVGGVVLGLRLLT